METVGRILLVVIGTPLLAAYPLSEMARGMASNPGQHSKSRIAAGCSLIGASLIGAGIFA